MCFTRAGEYQICQAKVKRGRFARLGSGRVDLSRSTIDSLFDGTTRSSMDQADGVPNPRADRVSEPHAPFHGGLRSCGGTADLEGMKQVFNTSVGTIEVLVDRASRTISIYRFDEQHRAIAAAIESWDHVDLLDVLNRQAGVPLTEANRLAGAVREQHMSLGSLAERLEQRAGERRGWSSLEKAGIALRFVAVLLDAVIVFLPMGIVVGLMTGGGYAERGAGYANAGIDVGDNAVRALFAGGIVHHYCGTRRAQALGDCGPDTLRCAGDNRYFAS